MISIIIPVYKEQHQIELTLQGLEQLEHQALLTEILIVQGPGETYTVPTLISDVPGRAVQMNYAAQHAKGELLLFLHADSILPKQALPLIAQQRTGAFSLAFNSNRLLFRFLAWASTQRSKLMQTPYGDQALFLPKADFDNVGGFDAVPILEDVLLARKIHFPILEEYVTTSTRRYQQKGVWKTVFCHRLIMMGYALGISPEKLASWR